MTEHLDPRSRSIGLRRSHRLEGKLGSARTVVKEIGAARDQREEVEDSRRAEGSTLQAIGTWESEGGANYR